jgi:rhamnose transport system permease protein
MNFKTHRSEISVAITIAALSLVMVFAAPAFFTRENLRDLFLANIPILVVAVGMTLVILAGQIDISVGSIFAICSVAAGMLAKAGLPPQIALIAACSFGAGLGSINGALVAYARIPSIVVTLASMVALRDALRWETQGAWVEDLPEAFQWFGLSPFAYPVLSSAAVALLVTVCAWALRNLTAGRAVYATGSNHEAARLTGIDTSLVTFSVFAVAGLLTGFAAVLNSVRFNQIPSNTGIGLEMKVIAAVIVGGASITGGVGTIPGTVLGVILLGMIGPALTFLGVSAYWEKAIQGGIILTAIILDSVRVRSEKQYGASAGIRA